MHWAAFHTFCIFQVITILHILEDNRAGLVVRSKYVMFFRLRGLREVWSAIILGMRAR